MDHTATATRKATVSLDHTATATSITTTTKVRTVTVKAVNRIVITMESSCCYWSTRGLGSKVGPYWTVAGRSGRIRPMAVPLKTIIIILIKY